MLDVVFTFSSINLHDPLFFLLSVLYFPARLAVLFFFFYFILYRRCFHPREREREREGAREDSRFVQSDREQPTRIILFQQAGKTIWGVNDDSIVDWKQTMLGSRGWQGVADAFSWTDETRVDADSERHTPMSREKRKRAQLVHNFARAQTSPSLFGKS